MLLPLVPHGFAISFMAAAFGPILAIGEAITSIVVNFAALMAPVALIAAIRALLNRPPKVSIKIVLIQIEGQIPKERFAGSTMKFKEGKY